MSVLVKGMEMPKSCSECRFFVDAWCYAFKADDWRNAYNRPPQGERLNNCPLVPVPPHGRLIDADALNYTMLYKENWMSGTGVEAPAVWRKDINDAPTIIEADPEEEEMK